MLMLMRLSSARPPAPTKGLWSSRTGRRLNDGGGTADHYAVLRGVRAKRSARSPQGITQRWRVTAVNEPMLRELTALGCGKVAANSSKST
jgi:hypothetical protein